MYASMYACGKSYTGSAPVPAYELCSRCARGWVFTVFNSHSMRGFPKIGDPNIVGSPLNDPKLRYPPNFPPPPPSHFPPCRTGEAVALGLSVCFQGEGWLDTLGLGACGLGFRGLGCRVDVRICIQSAIAICCSRWVSNPLSSKQNDASENPKP